MIRDYLDQDPALKVVGTAANGEDALKTIETLRPDVVTLDVQMPGMNGLETLDRLLSTFPVPVIMVSALTHRGADSTLQALDRGALDYVTKPENKSDVETVFGVELAQKIRSAAGINVRRIIEIRQKRKLAARRPVLKPKTVQADNEVPASAAGMQDKCIAIGISTGGPPALAALFEELQPPLPPIVIVQHMPPQFTRSLAWRLNALGKISVKEAETGDTRRPNHALLAPGGSHMQLRRRGKSVTIRIFDGDPVSGHKPSVDVMMKSAAEAFGPACLGIIMTGMGRDGADGCRAIREAGGYVLGQDDDSSDVYGMNKVAYVEGNVDQQFALEQAVPLIKERVAKLSAAQLAPVT